MPETPLQYWTLYLLQCADGAYYTGITTDFLRRFNEHLAGVGAKYTRSNPPVAVVGLLEFADRARASRAEAAVKKLPRAAKPAYFA
ncbi:MAG: GIY-YIG nuclease family protein [Burkholderiales bacterium]